MRTFGTPSIRPEARHVSNVRPRLDLQSLDVVSCHISALMHDCWSQCMAESSYIRVWYQTDQTHQISYVQELIYVEIITKIIISVDSFLRLIKFSFGATSTPVVVRTLST
jgi:hypothetical protein